MVNFPFVWQQDWGEVYRQNCKNSNNSAELLDSLQFYGIV